MVLRLRKKIRDRKIDDRKIATVSGRVEEAGSLSTFWTHFKLFTNLPEKLHNPQNRHYGSRRN
jgi:hypothetical protein